jgi:UDP-3-O-acyl-N-acetylglucosamine deacetylase
MAPQHTIASEKEIQGVGIHTGRPVRCLLRPAPSGAGVRFIRRDRPSAGASTAQPADGAVLTVDDAALNGFPGRTTLKRGDVMVQTVEHVLAAAAGMGVDNMDVVLDADEPPAGDGSAQPYAELIAQAGLTAQDAERAMLMVCEPLSLTDGHATIAALPLGRGLKITYTLDYPGTPLAQGHASFAVSPESFRKEIAPARTFCLLGEVDRLRAMGLGQG